MNRLALAVVTMMAAFLLKVNDAHAQDVFHPSRVCLLIHGGHDFNDQTRLELRFVPAGNLIGELAPLAFMGAKVRATDWLGVETYTGIVFANNEPLVSLSFNPHHGKLWVWTATDLFVLTHGGYWFAQVDYQLLDWLHAGVEGEGWGNWEDASSWSHGGGPNMLMRFGMTGTDLALHVRELNGEDKPEVFFRVHLFL